MPRLLEIQRLTVRIDGRHVVDGATFSARAGEVVAVVGPNGAGKTTLLEGLLGLRASEGDVSCDGTRLRSFGERAAAFAYMPDEAALPEEASVETVLRACSADADARRLAARRFEVEALLGSGARELSRGEAKRVWLAATVLLKRPILVLDEPFGAFDPLQLDRLLPALKDALGERGIALVTIHQMSIAERVADRIVIVSSGRVIAEGPLAELRAKVGSDGASLEDVFRSLLRQADHVAA